MIRTQLKQNLGSRSLELISKEKSKHLRKLIRNLDEYLPRNWEKYYDIVGNGIYIRCKICGKRPHDQDYEVMPWQMWKWISVHLMTEHFKDLEISAVPSRDGVPTPKEVRQLRVVGGTHSPLKRNKR